MARVASRQRALKSRTSVLDPVEQEQRQDQKDVAQVEAKLANQKADDKLQVVDVLEGKEWIISQSLTQSFGMKTIEHFKGDVSLIPKWRFSRRYLGEKTILVDLFRKQKDYDAADVEARRKLVNKLGGHYAALGPGHSRLPHKDKALREKYPSLVEQLGL